MYIICIYTCFLFGISADSSSSGSRDRRPCDHRRLGGLLSVQPSLNYTTPQKAKTKLYKTACIMQLNRREMCGSQQMNMLIGFFETCSPESNELLPGCCWVVTHSGEVVFNSIRAAFFVGHLSLVVVAQAPSGTGREVRLVEAAHRGRV